MQHLRSTVRADAPPTAAEIRALVEADPARAFTALWGEANRALSTRREARWGRRGSKVVALVGDRAGCFFDHETGVGGDFIAAVADVTQAHFPVALRAAAEVLHCAGEPAVPSPAPRAPTQTDDDRRRIAEAIFADAEPIAGTPAEDYLRRHRRLTHLPGLDHCARFHGGCPRGRERRPALLWLMTDALTNEPTGIERQFLRPDGRKDGRAMALGQRGVIRISPDEDVEQGLFVAEGAIDALRLIEHGYAPAWAAGGTSGFISFPVLPLSLSIVPDNEHSAIAAAAVLAESYDAAGGEAEVVVFGTPGQDPDEALGPRHE